MTDWCRREPAFTKLCTALRGMRILRSVPNVTVEMCGG